MKRTQKVRSLEESTELKLTPSVVPYINTDKNKHKIKGERKETNGLGCFFCFRCKRELKKRRRKDKNQQQIQDQTLTQTQTLAAALSEGSAGLLTVLSAWSVNLINATL